MRLIKYKQNYRIIFDILNEWIFKTYLKYKYKYTLMLQNGGKVLYSLYTQLQPLIMAYLLYPIIPQ